CEKPLPINFAHNCLIRFNGMLWPRIRMRRRYTDQGNISQRICTIDSLLSQNVQFSLCCLTKLNDIAPVVILLKRPKHSYWVCPYGQHSIVKQESHLSLQITVITV